MLEYPEIHEDYASYASLRENNCVGYTILGSNDFNVRFSLSRIS